MYLTPFLRSFNWTFDEPASNHTPPDPWNYGLTHVSQTFHHDVLFPSSNSMLSKGNIQSQFQIWQGQWSF
jgi:hypothetical protein